MSKTIIYDTYKRCGDSETYYRVQDRINEYIKNNISALSDGIVNSTPIISANVRDRIAEPFNIDAVSWKEIEKSKEMKLMKHSASKLRLGLIVAYCDTKNPIFLSFLMILIYSSRMTQYFPNGYDSNIMKYTIDHADARTDFKKTNSLILVVNKKVETFSKLFKNRIKVPADDKLIRDILQSIFTRINEAIKALSKKYYKNFNDPDVKIMMEYGKTDDGKNSISPLGVMEVIREKAVNNLQMPSEKILNMIGLGAQNTKNFPYRRLIVSGMEDCFGLLSMATNELLNEWIKRNTGKITMSNFRTTFVKSMHNARNISHIMKFLEDAALKMMGDKTKEELKGVDKLDLRLYLYDYIILNLYTVSGDLL